MKSPSSRPSAFRRIDETSDAVFYSMPRKVYHIDEAAVAAVTQLYRRYLQPGGDTLDLMSSWVSHFPEELALGKTTGLGMNAEELRANPRLSDWLVQDLNEKPQLPFANAVFDQAVICVSVDYLVHPLAIFDELARVLRPGGPLIVTFSNRCFPTKVIQAWLQCDDAGRIAWVKDYFHRTGPWRDIQAIDASPGAGRDPLYGVIGYAQGT